MGRPMNDEDKKAFELFKTGIIFDPDAPKKSLADIIEISFQAGRASKGDNEWVETNYNQDAQFGFNPNWISEDWNLQGVRPIVLHGDYFGHVRWCPSHDEFEIIEAEDCEQPTHILVGFKFPNPPHPPQQEREAG